MDSPTGTSCPVCSRHHTPADARGLDWSSVHTPDGIRFVCPRCTRDHLIETECGLPVQPVELPASA